MRMRSYLLLIALAILTPVIIFSGLALSKLHDSLHESAEQNQLEIARSVALAIDQELTSARSAMRVLAASSFLEDADYASFHRHAQVANIGETGWIILYDASGDQVVNTRVPYGTPLRTARDRGEVVDVLNKGEVATTNLFFGQAAQQYVLMLEMPVVLPSGKKYVLSQAFLPEHFQRAFEARNISANWRVGIFDRKGVIISRSHRPSDFIGKPVIGTMRTAMDAEAEGTLLHRTSDGVEVFDVFTRSRHSGWVVAVGAPVSELEAATNRALLLWVGGLLLAALAAGAIATVLVRRLAASIRTMADEAVELGRGMPLAPAKATELIEMDRLSAALRDASKLLEGERTSRTIAEAERARLLDAEMEARRTAEQTNLAKDRFLAMLSHELRNPISAITAAISVLELNLGPSAVKRAVDVMRRQGTHLRHIVDDLLDVSRALSGRMSLNTQRLDLATIVENSVASLQAAGRTGEHALTLTMDRVWVDADPVRMDQVVTNLIDNALKYTQSGGGIEVEAREQDGEAVLSVTDNGIGIAPELLPRVFDVFVQADDSLDRSRGGLGIGLSLVRELVRLHGGTITAASDGLGRGSRFEIRLPLTKAPEAENSPASEQPSPEARTILLIEDNADARQLFALMLESSGHRVLQAGNGEDGIRMARESSPDIAFVDIGLPGIDGYQVARCLRTDPITTKLALVALSGYGNAADVELALNAGFDKHLAKPARLADLLQTLDSLLPRQA